MAEEWYYLKGEQQVGPISREKILSAYQWGDVNSQTLVWSDGMSDWQPAGHVPGLLPTVAAAQPPASPVGMGQAPQPFYVQTMKSNAPGAVTSFVLGLIGVFTCALLGIPAIMLGNSAKRHIQQNPGAYQGEGLATAGIVLGILGLLLQCLVCSLWITRVR